MFQSPNRWMIYKACTNGNKTKFFQIHLQPFEVFVIFPICPNSPPVFPFSCLMLITPNLMFPLITSFMPPVVAVESKQGGVRGKNIQGGNNTVLENLLWRGDGPWRKPYNSIFTQGVPLLLPEPLSKSEVRGIFTKITNWLTPLAVL